jgi:hypothetical protein
MAQQVCVVLSAAEREQLGMIAADRNRPRKHVERACIVLASGGSARSAAGRAQRRRQPADRVALAAALRRERG